MPVVFDEGDVFVPTEAELDAFGDKLDPVDADTPTSVGSASAEPTGPSPTGRYELLHGKHRTTDDDGTPVVYTEGDVVELTDAAYAGFDDKFRPLDVDDQDSTESDDAEGEGSESDPDGEPEEAAETTDDDVEEAVEEADAETDVVESDGALAVPDDYTYDLPEDFPDELPDDFQALRALAPANGVDGNQSKADLIDDLETVRDQNGGD